MKWVTGAGWKPLPFARDPFRGACPGGGVMPRQVLMFSREDREGLLRGARDSFQHRRFVLIFNAATAGRVALDGSWLSLKPGQALLVFPYQVHSYAALSSTRLRWLFLTFEAEAPASWEAMRGQVLDASPVAWEMLAAAAAVWRHEKEQGQSLAYWTGLILLELLKQRRGVGEAQGVRRGHLLTRVHAWMHGPENKAWRIEPMARGLGLSASHLRGRFRQETGMSLGAYVKKVRITRAAALLAGSERSVGEIAVLCGYESLYSFSRSFRQATGSSPRAYRKEEAQLAAR